MKTAADLTGLNPYCPGFTPQRCPISFGHAAHSYWKQLLAGWRICLTCMTEVSGLQGYATYAQGSSRLQKQPLNHKQTVIIASRFIFVWPSPAPSIRWTPLKPPLPPTLPITVCVCGPRKHTHIHPHPITPKGELRRGPVKTCLMCTIYVLLCICDVSILISVCVSQNRVLTESVINGEQVATLPSRKLKLAMKTNTHKHLTFCSQYEAK